MTIYREKPEPLAAPGVWILDRDTDDDGIETTWYAGTKKAMVVSGIVPARIFRIGKRRQRWNTRFYIPVHERFRVYRERGYWTVALYRQIEANEKPDLEGITNEDKPTETRSVVIPFPMKSERRNHD